MRKILKINEKMTIKIWVKLNRNNIRIIVFLESQKENPYGEAIVKHIIAEKFPEMKSKYPGTG